MKRTIVLLLFVALLVSACSGKTTTTMTDGDSKVTVESTGDNSWCPAGGNWKYSGSTEAGMANAEWKVDKLMTSGKYSGLCHVIYTAEGPQGDVNMDYYFSEDGDSGYVVMDVNGQKIESEWSN